MWMAIVKSVNSAPSGGTIFFSSKKRKRLLDKWKILWYSKGAFLYTERYRSGHNGADSKSVCGLNRTRVRIPSSPPTFHRSIDSYGGFSMLENHLKSRFLPFQPLIKQPLRSISTAVFLLFTVFSAFWAAVIVKLMGNLWFLRVFVKRLSFW